LCDCNGHVLAVHENMKIKDHDKSL
jgi:hypothetical protein